MAALREPFTKHSHNLFFCNQRLKARYQRVLSAKCSPTPLAWLIAWLSFPALSTQSTLPLPRRFTDLGMAGFAFVAQLCHIAHHHDAVARHFRLHLHRRRHRANVRVVGVIKQQLVFRKLNREQTPGTAFRFASPVLIASCDAPTAVDNAAAASALGDIMATLAAAAAHLCHPLGW